MVKVRAEMFVLVVIVISAFIQNNCCNGFIFFAKQTRDWRVGIVVFLVLRNF
jgi:hypothetical protein